MIDPRKRPTEGELFEDLIAHELISQMDSALDDEEIIKDSEITEEL